MLQLIRCATTETTLLTTDARIVWLIQVGNAAAVRPPQLIPATCFVATEKETLER